MPIKKAGLREKKAMAKLMEDAWKEGASKATAHGIALSLIETVLGAAGTEAGRGAASFPILRNARTAEFVAGGDAARTRNAISPLSSTTRPRSGPLSPTSKASSPNRPTSSAWGTEGRSSRSSRGSSPTGRVRQAGRSGSPTASQSPSRRGLRSRSPSRSSRPPASTRSKSPSGRIAPTRSMSPAARSTKRAGQGDDRAEVPQRLAPLHVFGYNGATGGGNVKQLATGQVIYDAGAHIILLNPTTRDMEIFTGHSEEVACFALHPDGVRVASGDSGFEPTVLVWDSTNLLNLGSLKPFDHAVDDNITGKTKCAGSIDGLGYRWVVSLITRANIPSIGVNVASLGNLLMTGGLRVGIPAAPRACRLVKAKTSRPSSYYCGLSTLGFRANDFYQFFSVSFSATLGPSFCIPKP
jgi:hypothetical protein